ncbi:MAG: UUP1 family membrane protein [Alphaproteobacteria bacterium]|nr:UUP1 family membrane protein [Alphaproteobacteria bacterium]
MKRFFSVNAVLTTLLVLSIIFAAAATYYKITYWGFSFKPSERTDVWTIDAKVSFVPNGDPIDVSLSLPSVQQGYKILSEDVVANGYEIQKDEKNRRLSLKSKAHKNKQNLYYRVMLYDTEDGKGKFYEEAPQKTKITVDDEQQKVMVDDIWRLVDEQKSGTRAERLIKLLNEKPLSPEVDAFLPVKNTTRVMADKIIFLLGTRGIPARVIRGVMLSEKKRMLPADMMIEAYEGSKWIVYDINSGKAGLPKDFIVFQRGGVSLLDVSGGYDSQVRFSVIKSVVSSFKMAGSRAKYDGSRLFNYTIYDLPTLEQNTLKWLMIFPLGILLVVILRNVIGISTMGTFTPMLVAMSLIKTGFIYGVLCFAVIIGLGLAVRTMLTRLNLLLVPRISAVVIFVILIMQMLTVFGYHFDLKVAASAVFFPIIITAWIIERACITWEEDGVKNATKQIVNTVFVAIITYFVISSEYIRHIMFAFNEWNLVILLIVMLLGTYTGYRLTELKRFAPLIKDK